MKMKRLTPSQITVLTVSGILGVDILMVQHRMASIAGVDAWISLGLGGILVFIVSVPLLYLINLYPNKDVPRIVLAIAGKWLGRIILVPIIVFFIIYAGLSARIFVQVLKKFLVDKTPMWVIIISMVAVTIYMVDKGVYTLGAVMDILFPIYIVTLGLLIALTLPGIDTLNLRPILFKNAHNVAKGIIPGFSQFTGYAVAPFFICHVGDKKKARKAYLFGLGIPILLYIVLTLISIMIFGAAPLEAMLYPTLNLSKSIEFGSGILNRLEAFMAIFWISMVFGSMAIFTYGSLRNISEFLAVPVQGRRYVAYAHLFLLPALALVLPNDLDVLEFYHISKYVDSLLFLIIVPLLALWGGIKKRKEE